MAPATQDLEQQLATVHAEKNRHVSDNCARDQRDSLARLLMSTEADALETQKRNLQDILSEDEAEKEQSRLAEMRQSMDMAASDLERRAVMIEVAEEKLVQQHQELEEAKQELLGARAELEEAAQQLQSKQKELDDRVETVWQQMEAVRKEFEESRQQAEATFEAERLELQSLEAQLREGLAELAQRQSRAEALRDELSQRQRQVLSAEEDLSERQRRASALEDELSQKQHQISVMEEQIEQRQRQATAQQQDLDQRQRQATTLQQDLDQRGRQATALQQYLDQRQRQATTDQQDLDEREKQVNGLMAELNQRESVLSRLQEEVAQQQGQLQDLEREFTQQASQVGRAQGATAWQTGGNVAGQGSAAWPAPPPLLPDTTPQRVLTGGGRTSGVDIGTVSTFIREGDASRSQQRRTTNDEISLSAGVRGPPSQRFDPEMDTPLLGSVVKRQQPADTSRSTRLPQSGLQLQPAPTSSFPGSVRDSRSERRRSMTQVAAANLQNQTSRGAERVLRLRRVLTTLAADAADRTQVVAAQRLLHELSEELDHLTGMSSYRDDMSQGDEVTRRLGRWVA
eukprot:gene16138-22292_t